MSATPNARPLAGSARRRSDASTQGLPDNCAASKELCQVDVAAFGRDVLSAAAEHTEADPATWQSVAMLGRSRWRGQEPRERREALSGTRRRTVEVPGTAPGD